MNKSILILLILVSLSCMACVGAADLDNATDNLTQQDTQDLEVVMEPEDDDFIAKSNDSDVLQTPSPENKLSSGESDSSAYLVLDNDADKENIFIGDYVTWIVSVENKGPANAKNVKVFNQLPKGLKYINHSATQGTFNQKTGIWDIGELLNGSEVFLYITTLAVSTGEKINKANLTSETFNPNDETYEEEEIDVFDHKNENSKNEPENSKTYSQDSIRPTGNPLALIFLSLLGCFIACFKK